jgi:hypothetical protein
MYYSFKVSLPFFHSAKNLYTSWSGTAVIPGTMYAVTESGWMTTSVFQAWFECFLQRVLERPLLIIFDGHKTHLSLPFIQLARANQVSVIKLPSHTTNRLQPLDVSCFKPLKTAWDKELVRKQRESGFRHLSKSDFVDSLCSIWGGALKPDSVKAGFEKTGIFPMDSSKFPIQTFQKSKLVAYQAQHPPPMPQEQPPLPAVQPIDVNLAIVIPPPSPSPMPAANLPPSTPSTDNSALISELLATVKRLSDELQTRTGNTTPPAVISTPSSSFSQPKSLTDVSRNRKT